jgi:cytochrome oxidase assembly protein ShyY1
MKFIHYLENISGVSVYPLVSMLLFLTVFTLAIWQVVRQSKESINEQKNLPLQS